MCIRKLMMCAAVSAAMLPGAAWAQASGQAVTHSADPWWKHAVFYEVYPRSLQDSNGDGVGDINGITMRLDKLKHLGVDAIWIAPAYPSPQVDFGYDISDYESIDPQYGTLADFDKLVAEAKKRDMRIVMDAVLNHTSDKHSWFIESASSRTNAKADWYVWSDGIPASTPDLSMPQKQNTEKGPNGDVVPPNNWTSGFGGSAWQWVPARGQYYYHKFYKEQPDLNWRNPAVEKAIFDQLRFWLDRGVAGFRLDAIDTLLEDPSMTNEEPVRDKSGNVVKNSAGEVELMHTKTNDLPENHAILKRMRAVIDSYPGDRLLIGETYVPTIEDLYKWYGGDAHDEIQLPMDTQVGVTNKLDAAKWRTKLTEAETGLHGLQPLLVIDNHDNPRMDRYCKTDMGAAPGADCNEIQKMLTTVLFGSRAAALMYYGDEIAMSTTDPTRKEDVQDPVGRRYWPEYKGRDGERTPMQWDTGKDAGFSTADKTWLPIPPSYMTVNVATESGAKDSVYDWYRKLIELRRTNPVLRDGDQMVGDVGNDQVVAWTRSLNGKTVMVATNFSGTPQNISGGPDKGKKVKVLASTFHVPMEHFSVPESMTLPAYGAIVVEVE